MVAPTRKAPVRGRKAQSLAPPIPATPETPVLAHGSVDSPLVMDTPSRAPVPKRVAVTSVDLESDVEESDVVPTVEVAIAPVTPVVEPAKKRLKTTATTKTPAKAPSAIALPEWVPPSMKVDIINANANGNLDEVFSCLRWYIRLILMVKRDITAEDRKKAMMAMFGIGEAQAQMGEGDMVRVTNDGRKEAFGVIVGRKFKAYYNGLMAVLRERFDALLTMFWKCQDPGATDFIEGRIAIANITNKANAKRTLVKVDVDSTSTPIIFEGEVEEYFLKGNMKLVHDVWGCILDVVEPEFILQNAEWGQKLMRSTATILCWLITATFRLENPEAAIAAAVATGAPTAISVKDKTMALAKADIEFTGFPGANSLRKPANWLVGKRAVFAWYGELEGSKALKDAVEEVLEDEVKEEMVKAGGGIPETPKSLELEVLDITKIDESATWMIDMMQRRVEAFQSLEKNAMEKRVELGGKVHRLSQWMERAKVFQEKAMMMREAQSEVTRFLSDVERQYILSEKEENASYVEVRSVRDGVPATLEVMGSYQAWLARMKKQEWFAECMKDYEVSLYEKNLAKPNPPGRGPMMGSMAPLMGHGGSQRWPVYWAGNPGIGDPVGNKAGNTPPEFGVTPSRTPTRESPTADSQVTVADDQ